MFSKILKQLREKEGLLQSELAKKIGIVPSAVSMYETGVRIPDINMLIKISKYFNVSTDYLLGLTSSINNGIFDGPVIRHISMKEGHTINDMSEHDKKIIREAVISTLNNINNNNANENNVE
jgi:transcriptional regulator with XRE-family HTH domain